MHRTWVVAGRVYPPNPTAAATGGSLQPRRALLLRSKCNFQLQSMCKDAESKLGKCTVARGGGSGWSDGVAQGGAEIEGWWGSSSGGWIWIVRRAWMGGAIVMKCRVYDPSVGPKTTVQEYTDEASRSRHHQGDSMEEAPLGRHRGRDYPR